MANQRIVLLAIFILIGNFLLAQPNWREVVSPAFATVAKEITDSIGSRRAQAEKLRSEMDNIVAAKGFDRVMIFGRNDEYYKEGMSKLFKSTPMQMQANMNRDAQVVRLENLHVDLFHCDNALLRWLDFQTKLRNHPDMTLHGRWATQWADLPPNIRPNAKSLRDCQYWVAGQLVCDLVNLADSPAKNQELDKIQRFSPKWEPRPWDTIQEVTNTLVLPIPAESLIASFPVNGQFAFDRSESIPGVGYIAIPAAARPPLLVLNDGDRQYRARWTSARGQVTYTMAEYRYLESAFFFNLPDVFQPGMVYRLELISLPFGQQQSLAPPEEGCWEVFRGRLPAMQQLSLLGEIKITELFFRTSRYDVKQKLQTMKGKVDWSRNVIVYETDEPLDPIEMFGAGRMTPFVGFALQTSSFYQLKDAIDSRMVPYYLTVPRVEPVSNVPLDQRVTAERDHTIDAPFVRKVSLGNPEAYPKLPAESETNSYIYGGYIATPTKGYGLKDSLVTERPTPFITREHFLSGRPVVFAPTRCYLYVGELDAYVKRAQLHQTQLRRRVEERARFFYDLDKRSALQTNKPFTATFEQYKQQEMENLPGEVKTILDAKFPDVFSKELIILYSRRFPGTAQFSTQYSLTIDTTK